jgi:hypothetical protein
MECLGFIDFDGIRFSSHIGQLSSRLDLSRELPNGSSVRVGASAEHMRFENFARAGGTEFFSTKGSGVLGSAYATFRASPTDYWLIEPGLRVDLWTGPGDHRPLLSPRFAVKRFFGRFRGKRPGALPSTSAREI